MQVTQRYLDHFKLTFESPDALYALTPTEFRVNGIEEARHSVVLDVPEGVNVPGALSIAWLDENDDDAQRFELDEQKRRTFVIPAGRRTGYRFDGLLAPEDARLWFRHKYGLEAD